MKACLILGNGVSIDLINYLGLSDLIALNNLFKNGEKVKWPSNGKCGFLSYKNCPALWRLGARPNSSNVDSIKLIENVMTCVNVFASQHPTKRPKFHDHRESLYIVAYNELVQYLRQLFIYYDSLICDFDLKIKSKGWEWLGLVKNLYNDDSVEKIDIITYNYDIWIERILRVLNINYSMYLGEESESKITLYKPHGSINLIHKHVSDLDAFSIKDKFEDYNSVELEEFHTEFNNLECNPSIVPMIPPAGQSSRYNTKWAKKIRDKISETCLSYKKEDILVFGGISYWSVDRDELDDVIVHMSNEMGVYVVNPFPPEEFLAVLTTIFKDVIHFPDSKEILGELL